MKRFKLGCITAILAALLLPVPVAAQISAIDTAMSYDGLKRVNSPSFELAYIRPDAVFTGYTQVQIDPVVVAFAKSWDPNVPGSDFSISDRDREDIRQRAASLVHDSFVAALQTNGGYPIATSAAPNVLRVKISIVNLYITAPGIMSAGVSRSYVTSAGRATLYAEFFDSVSGQVLARLIDQKQARNNGQFIANRVTNTAAAKKITDKWARLVRAGLDKVRQGLVASPTPTPP